jgi:hypothetical protein
MFFAKKDLFDQLLKQILRNNRFSQRSLAERYGRLIEEAKKDWQEARAYFNTVTEPDLIDHAIYTLGAAEKRYVYLLKKAREESYYQEKLSL